MQRNFFFFLVSSKTDSLKGRLYAENLSSLFLKYFWRQREPKTTYPEFNAKIYPTSPNDSLKKY